MYICERCGKLFEDDELPSATQCHGYTSLGNSLDENIDGNCSCGGEIVEAVQCKVCGEWFAEDKIDGEVCDNCLEQYETVNEGIEMGAENATTVEVNGFVASLLSEEKINEILAKWVSENFVDGSKDVRAYFVKDRDYFAEWLAERYGD